MELQQTFTVPVPLDRAWEAFGDPERLAPCMPGATLESVDGDAFTGNVKIKLGPIGLTYRGQARFVDTDREAGTMVIEGKGKDPKGNSTASATITAQLTEAQGATTVTVTTDLALTGKPAQFGRGVMNDVADKLVGQFATNLAALLTSDAPGDPAPAAAPSPDQATTGAAPQGQAGPVAAPRPVPAAAAPASAELDALALIGIPPAARRAAGGVLVLANVFVLGWAIGRLGNRR
jgi:carbon monoxide dehydrogenase subunit G